MLSIIKNLLKLVIIDTIPRVFKALFQPLRILDQLYFGILKCMYKATRRKVGGELILLIFGLAWMLWPLFIPHFITHASRLRVWTLASIGATILVIRGYKVLANAGKRPIGN